MDAGAVALHIHPRSPTGDETLEAFAVAAALLAIRQSCPSIPLEVSTAAWIVKDPANRLALVQSWEVHPDSAGVNFGEPGAIELAELLLARGIGIEAGLFTSADARKLIQSGLASSCQHVQIEPILAISAATALTTAQAIEQELDLAGITTPRLLHGKDFSAWPMLRYAIARGYATRIGLEDTLYLPDGRLAQDNAELVKAALSQQVSN